MNGCWFATLPNAGPCDGALVKVHLIPRQLMRREKLDKELLWDARTWVWGCGGAIGLGGHHGALDASRTLRVPYPHLPVGLVQFAAENDLTWWLEREYRDRGVAA